tara:strand:+ start:137 stop:478 length:342 start_codon:yes stop_codon:yes gene_type:complete
MPANKYTRSLYKPGTVEAEKAAIANRDPARKAAAEKLLAREGTTNPSGGRGPSLAAKVAKAVGQAAPPVAPKSSLAAKVAKAVGQTPRATPKASQVIRTTTNMKPTPPAKKKK